MENFGHCMHTYLDDVKENFGFWILCTHLDNDNVDLILVCVYFEDNLDLDIELVPCKKKKLIIRQK